MKMLPQKRNTLPECGCKVMTLIWISQKLLMKNAEKMAFVCVLAKYYIPLY